MDIQLPLMDGYTSAREIKKVRSDIVILAQTAYGLAEDMEKIRTSGFDDHIIKPIFADQLVNKISSLLGCK
jgi:CheY-like chemotaxis protein